LWEMYLIHGVERRLTALLTKVHHAVIDGLSGAEIMSILLDLEPEGRELPEPAPRDTDGAPSDVEMLARGLLGVPRYPLRILRSLDEVKAVKSEHGYTVNDVVVAICAGAVRRWLVEHGELPPDPLVAQIPVSVRTEEEVGTYGNRIVLMHAPLFTNVEDPTERLHRTHEALRVMKERHRALPADLLRDANHFIPPAVFSRAARATFALPGRAPE